MVFILHVNQTYNDIQVYNNLFKHFTISILTNIQCDIVSYSIINKNKNALGLALRPKLQ